jgi:uncharacterized protein YdeI (YjbR/CyaY-like superfamily)
MAVELPELLRPDAAAWLLEHHTSSPGVWLVLHKQGGAVTSLTYTDAVEEALCFGWINGQAKKRDDETYLQRMTPRGARSAWSARNVERVARLEREGRMQEAGRAAVDAAKADGRWDRAYEGPATATVSPDLAHAVAANPEAQAMFEVLTSTNRYALTHRLGAVKRAETRERKIREFVEMLARHETPYPQRRKPD